LSDQPNLLFCMCDELQWAMMGCYGHPTIRTPHLDRLAAMGTRFDVGISNAPVCLPARSVVLSGQHPRTCCGMTGNVLYAGPANFSIVGCPQWPTTDRGHLPDPTMPELLRDAGYTTSAIGKWHVEAWPDHVGFDHYCIPAHHHAHSAQWFCEDGGPVFSPPGYSVDYEAQRVCDYLQDRAADGSGQPFFMYYNLSPPHMPIADGPEHYTRMYRREDVVLRDNVDAESVNENRKQQFLTYLWDYRHYRDHLPYTRELPSPDFDLIDLIAMYMGMVTWVDDAMGRVLDQLDATGLADNTVVVFTADHGDHLGSWGRLGKGMWRDESARVPMLVRGPGILADRVTGQVGSLVDWAPTFLEFAGGTAPAHWQGQSLTPVLTGQSETLDRNHVFIECGQGVAVRTPTTVCGIPWDGGDQLTPNRPIRQDPNEMFNMLDDPFSLNNLIQAGQPFDQAEAERLAALIREFDRTTAWKHRTQEHL